AYDVAVDHFERALAFDDARPGTVEQRCETLLALGDAWLRAGHPRRSRGAFQRAAELARGMGRPELLSRAALGHAGPPVMPTPDPATVDLLEQALAAIPPAETSLRASLLGALGAAISSADGANRKEQLIDRATEMADRVDDVGALANMLTRRRYAVWQTQDV